MESPVGIFFEYVKAQKMTEDYGNSKRELKEIMVKVVRKTLDVEFN